VEGYGLNHHFAHFYKFALVELDDISFCFISTKVTAPLELDKYSDKDSKTKASSHQFSLPYPIQIKKNKTAIFFGYNH